MSDIIITQDQLDEFAKAIEDCYYWDDALMYLGDDDYDEDEDDEQDKYSDYEPEEDNEEFELECNYKTDEKLAEDAYQSLMMQCSIKGMDSRSTRYLETELYQDIALEGNNPLAMARALRW